MAQQSPAFGVVGLGLMGGGLAEQALDKGMGVAGYTLGDAPAHLVEKGLTVLHGLDEFRDALAPPRIVLIYVPAGPAVDHTLDGLAESLEPGDVVADGGNSYWGDSVRRSERLRRQGLLLCDVGTSGGVQGARHGASFMAGGEPQALRHLAPLLESLAVDGGYVHAGPPGAGHYVKLVHNGIEFGMLQAIAEGVDLLERHPADLAVADVLRCWQNGTVIRSWLVDLMAEAYEKQGGLGDVPPYVEDTGEVNWLVSDAMELETPIPVIAQSVMQLFASRDESQNWARAVAMMRHGFGSHPFGADDGIQRERRQSRVGPIYRHLGDDD